MRNYKDEKYKKYHKLYNRKYYYKKRRELIEKLGGKCVICGSTNNLEFDHINSLIKKYNIGKVIKSSSKINNEINNLQLLCHNCHLNKTKNIDFPLKNSNEDNPNCKVPNYEVFFIKFCSKVLSYGCKKLSKLLNFNHGTINDYINNKIRKNVSSKIYYSDEFNLNDISNDDYTIFKKCNCY